MNAGIVGSFGRSSIAGHARLWPRVAVSLVLCVLAFDAIAQSDELRPGFGSQALARGMDERARPQLEISASSLPRFENIDGATRSSRLDMTLLPPGRSSVGPSLGVTSMDGPGFNAAGLANNSPTVDLGVHWRYMTEGNSRIDVRAWRRMPHEDALSLVQSREASYGARVDMQLGALPKPGFIADHGVGFQLESGARITLRRSGGKPMVFYRAKF